MNHLIKATLLFFILCSSVEAGAVAAVKQQQQTMQQQTMQQGAMQQAAMQQMAVQQVVVQQAALEQATLQQAALAQHAIAQAHQGLEIEMSIPIQQEITIPNNSQPTEIADISDVLKSLENSSHAWALIIDVEPKTFIVKSYVDFFAKQGARISKPAEFYVQMIDGMAQQNPQMLDNTFEDMFRVLAIIEYDFDIGADKDELAKKILGADGFRANKERLRSR